MDAVMKTFQSVINAVPAFLPDSPFRPFIDSISNIPYLGYLNYFIPVSDFIALLTGWVFAIALFYAASSVLRMVRAID